MPLAPGETYTLQKSVWTEVDFEKMGWHDVVVHGFAFDTESHELLLDIDYIFAWVDPAPPDPHYSFWVAPTTLVFREVWELKIDYEANLGFQLQDITRSEARVRPHPLPEARKNEWRWTLETEGEMSFWASGYSQYIRHFPAHHKGQFYRLSERGGISFERPQTPKSP